MNGNTYNIQYGIDSANRPAILLGDMWFYHEHRRDMWFPADRGHWIRKVSKMEFIIVFGTSPDKWIKRLLIYMKDHIRICKERARIIGVASQHWIDQKKIFKQIEEIIDGEEFTISSHSDEEKVW